MKLYEPMLYKSTAIDIHQCCLVLLDHHCGISDVQDSHSDVVKGICGFLPFVATVGSIID